MTDFGGNPTDSNLDGEPFTDSGGTLVVGILDDGNFSNCRSTLTSRVDIILIEDSDALSGRKDSKLQGGSGSRANTSTPTRAECRISLVAGTVTRGSSERDHEAIEAVEGREGENGIGVGGLLGEETGSASLGRLET